MSFTKSNANACVGSAKYKQVSLNMQALSVQDDARFFSR